MERIADAVAMTTANKLGRLNQRNIAATKQARNETNKPSTRYEAHWHVTTGFRDTSAAMRSALCLRIPKSIDTANTAKNDAASAIHGAALAISMLPVVSKRARAIYQGPFA